jgi:hypothetical protein
MFEKGWEPAFRVEPYKERKVSKLAQNVRLGCKCMTDLNTLTYYNVIYHTKEIYSIGSNGRVQ